LNRKRSLFEKEKRAFLKESCAKNFNDINTVKVLMSLNNWGFSSKKWASFFKKERTSSHPQIKIY